MRDAEFILSRRDRMLMGGWLPKSGEANVVNKKREKSTQRCFVAGYYYYVIQLRVYNSLTQAS